MKKSLLVCMLSLGVMAACTQNTNESTNPSASTDDVEVVYDEPETMEDVEPLDITQPNARETSATATTQYFQCKTDDGELFVSGVRDL